MIFRRALVKEFAELAVAVLLVLVGVAVTSFLIRYLGQAAAGRVAADAVLALVGFHVLAALHVLLTLTLFIAVLMALNRSYRDNEMAVWFSSGVSITAWVWPVLSFALPLALVTALLTLFLSPWALSRSLEYVQQLESRDETALVAAGMFKESSEGSRTFYVEEFSPLTGTVKNVFAHFLQHGRPGALVAATGRQELAENGDRFLVLEHGRRYEGRPGQLDFRIAEFERYAMRIQTREARRDDTPTKAMATPELARSTANDQRAELAWRISFPVTGIMLALLAIPLSFVNPRAGRSINLVMALLVFFIYSNMLSVVRAWGAQGKADPLLAAAGVHLAMLVLLGMMLWRRISVRSLWPWRR